MSKKNRKKNKNFDKQPPQLPPGLKKFRVTGIDNEGNAFDTEGSAPNEKYLFDQLSKTSPFFKIEEI